MKIIALQPHLYRLSFGFVSAYLIDDGDELVLVDTGTRGNAARILSAIASVGLDPSRLRHILITQLHTDHVGSLAELQHLSSARIYAHVDEADAIEEGTTLRPSVAAPTIQSRLIVKLLINPNVHTRIKGCAVDKRLEDGEILDLAGGIQTIHTPGHTAGHCSFLWNNSGGVLLAGDVAGGGKTPKYPMLFENREQGFASIRKLAELDFETAYFAHGASIPTRASASFRDAWD